MNSSQKAAVFFDQVARHILAQHQNEIPDLRRAVVLLPNYQVAQPLAQALVVAAQRPALLLPKMVTPDDWAQSIPLAATVVPDTCRAAALYQALRARRWFQDSDLWGITGELLGLLDELTRHQVALPQGEEGFLAQLERAYRARRGAAMQFEARVVYELWYAMSAGSAPDAARAYQQRLAQLAQQAEAPLYLLLASGLAAPEARFIEAYRERAPVTVFDLREMAARQPGCAVLVAALQSPSLHLRDQALHLRERYPDAALELRLFGAHSLEQEARAAAVQVRRWLLEGKTNIALVALDRLVARRVRALLERAGVLIRDETGWTLSTLSASTVLMRWLDVLQSDFYHEELLDLLKSPFIFAEQPAHERKRTVFLFEQLVRKHGVASRLQSYLDLAAGQAEVQMALARLRQARSCCAPCKPGNWNCRRTARVSAAQNGGAGWRSSLMPTPSATGRLTARCGSPRWPPRAGAALMRCCCWAAMRRICRVRVATAFGSTMRCTRRSACRPAKRAGRSSAMTCWRCWQ